MNITMIKKEAEELSTSRPLINGTYDYLITHIRQGKTIKSKKDCIIITGEIDDENGPREVSTYILINNDKALKYGIAKLYRIAAKIGFDATIYEELEDLLTNLDIASRQAKTIIKLNILNKEINGSSMQVKEIFVK